MFAGAAAFNQPLNGWRVDKVTSTAGMFMKAASFNRPLGNWSLDALTKMPLMFRDAAAFDQDLGWCFDTHVRLNLAFDGTPCEATSCGVVQGPGGCAPSARPSAAP